MTAPPQPRIASSEVALLNAEGMTCNSHGHKSMVKEQQTPQSPEGTTEILSGSACRPFRTPGSLFTVSPNSPEAPVSKLCIWVPETRFINTFKHKVQASEFWFPT